MAEPVRAIQAASRITLEIKDIRFEEGKLWRPRYESLIDYSHAPEGFQFEPAFVAYAENDQEVEVVFRIAASQQAVFDLEDGEVKKKLLKGLPPVSVKLDDPKSCRVVWKLPPPGSEPLTALYIACRPPVGVTVDELTRVEGGVYLAIIRAQGDPPELKPSVNDVVRGRDGKVRLLGFENNQPVYDLFLRNAAPPELVLEPAFRAGHGERLPFRLALDFDPSGPYAENRFKVKDGQVEMIFNVPASRPAHLTSALAEDDQNCTIQWDRPECRGFCEEGDAASFSAVLTAPGMSGPHRVRIDPTVIEPPACDANGVCSPPRNWGPDGVSAG